MLGTILSLKLTNINKILTWRALYYCVNVHIYVYVFLWCMCLCGVCVCVGICTCIWRPDVNIGCTSSIDLLSYLHACVWASPCRHIQRPEGCPPQRLSTLFGLSLKLKLTVSAKLAGQLAYGICLSLPLQNCCYRCVPPHSAISMSAGDPRSSLCT